MHTPSSLIPLLAWTMGVYTLLMFALAAFAQRKVEGVEDFVVAGRRLPLLLSTATLLATWFGAGTLMAAADEIRASGARAAALDPLGAGLCLLLVGVFFAKPLWREKLLTLPELFGRRFGDRARWLGAVLMIPPYLGWIAAQFMALAGILNLFFGLDLDVGLALIALVSVGYTLLGGMWAVTLTDAVQMLAVIIGLGVIVYTLQTDVAWGPGGVMEAVPPGHEIWIPTDSLAAFVGWIGVLAAGSLGNIPSQDVAQRVFSARSAAVAKAACLAAGGLYLLLGLAPILMGLTGAVLFGTEGGGPVVPRLAALFLSPPMAVLFMVTLMSTILSTIDSALLAPATVLAQDLWPGEPRLPRFRVAVLIIGVISLGFAYLGETAYSLLESGYELGMVSLMAPLVYAVYAKRHHAGAALASMLVGTISWGLHFGLGAEWFLGVEALHLPVGLASMGLSFLAYPLVLKLRA